MDVRKTVLVGHSAERMFDVIEAAEHYPDFLPWCAGAAIVARSNDEVMADITVNFHGVRFGFRTRNPKRRPEWMAIHLEHGPFRHFGGTWNVAPLAAEGCRVDFELHYDFESTPMARLARPVFDRIANTLVDRFVARADEIHTFTEPSPTAQSAPAAAENATAATSNPPDQRSDPS